MKEPELLEPLRRGQWLSRHGPTIAADSSRTVHNRLQSSGHAWFDWCVDERVEGAGVWHEMPYDEAWVPFEARFKFKPNFYERTAPVIELADDCLVIDLEPIFRHEGARFAAGEAAINAAALRSFVWLLGDDSLTALDWQHTPYRYSPADHVLSSLEYMPIPVFPNGDYYVHMSRGAGWGTFGHPWQQSLTIWGNELIDALGAELGTRLPRYPQSSL